MVQTRSERDVSYEINHNLSHAANEQDIKPLQRCIDDKLLFNPRKEPNNFFYEEGVILPKVLRLPFAD